MTTIPQPVINTFKRVGILYEYPETNEKVTVYNRFGGGSCETTPFVRDLINWVYNTSNDYEYGINRVNLSDFDRVRYYILKVDPNAYMTCID